MSHRVLSDRLASLGAAAQTEGTNFAVSSGGVGLNKDSSSRTTDDKPGELNRGRDLHVSVEQTP